MNETTGAHIAKRQSLNIIQDVAQDYVPFYKKRQLNEAEDTDDLLILTFDGKGIVMRPEGLRACTQKAAKKRKIESEWPKWLQHTLCCHMSVVLNPL